MRCNLNPDDLRAWRVRGAVRERLNDDEGAIADYSEAIKRDPKDVRLYMARSAVYVRMKKFAESLEDREQAVQLDPKNPEVYVARGGSYHLLGPARKGLEDRTRAIGLIPPNPPWGGRRAATPTSCWSAGTRRFPIWTKRKAGSEERGNPATASAGAVSRGREDPAGARQGTGAGDR